MSRIRVLHALRKEPDFSAMSQDDLVAFRDTQNRKLASGLARLITGFPDRGATINWQEVKLSDRVIPVRVYRPTTSGPLPLVVHVHGGGFMGTAVQCDWANSHLAAQLPAVVVSVEHRLVDATTPMSAAVDDGWEVLRHIVEHSSEWRIDPTRVAVAGESAGGLIAALAAIRARDSGLALRAQVLVNPAVDLTKSALDYTSMYEYAETPTLTLGRLEHFRRLAVPDSADARAVSPVYADDLTGLPPALVVVPTADPLADHGRTYVDRLREAGTPAQLAEHAGAGHAFLSMPGVVPQARAARTQITGFLRNHL
ncbi:alpha/beta hydrolase [Kribbella sp. NPDC050124]|uniref:alpha/beta hydrolase n=1 Tax=Kribbella sp. NPDC050124 TaxID=3364114 RepID=UPI0037A17C6F